MERDTTTHRTDAHTPSLGFYVSGHGFGHAARTAALLGALRARRPRLRVLVRSEAPPWLFTRRDPQAVCSAAALDVGVHQEGGLALDLPATLAAHEAFLEGWDAHLAREAAWLAETGVDLVVGDVPPLAFAAARRASVPSLAIANFCWDWILEPYLAAEPRFARVIERYSAAYRAAEVVHRLPFAGDFPAFREVREAPLLAHRSRRDRQQVLAALGLSLEDERPLVLVSFGGFGAGAVAPARWDDLADYRFLGPGPAPLGLPAPWTPLPQDGEVQHEDLVAACDVVLGKPGYSTCAEVVAHGARFLHLPRPDFREVPVLEAALAAYPCAARMPRRDFLEGRWRRHLDALVRLPRATPVPAPGAEHLAEVLLARLR